MRHRYLPLVLLPVLAGCVQAKSRPLEPASETAPFVRVSSVERFAGETSSTRYSASIVPDSQFDLAFKVGGYVRWIAETRGSDGRTRSLQGGDRVRRDAALARVRQIEYVTPVQQSISQVEQTQAQRRQAESSVREARASKTQAQAQLASSQASLREARAKREEAQAVLAEAQAGLTKSQAGLAEVQAALVARQVTLAETKLANDRAVALYGSNSMIKPEYDTAVANYERARSGVTQAEEQVAQLKAQGEQSQSQIEQAQSQLRQAQAQIDAANASIRIANAQIQGSQAKVDGAHDQVNVAVASIGGAKAQLTQNRVPLGDTTLMVPSDAIIIKRLVEVGALVKPGDPAFTLADISHVKAVFGVPDTRLGTVRLGSSVGVTSDARPGRRFQGQVTGISPSADPKSRVFEVEVTVPNADRQLDVGLVVTAEFSGSKVGELSMVVPMQAIIGRPGEKGGYGVYVVERSGETATARLRPVELGKVYGDQIAVTRGVEAGDQVVVSGPGLLHDGQTVRIEPGSAGEAQAQ